MSELKTRITVNSAAKQRPGFKPGQSGNPAGKPRGTRHKTTLAIEALLDGEAEGLTRKAVELALSGDMQALRLCLERVCPPRRDRPVSLALPKIKTAADALKASGAILSAVAGGEITPSEAAELGKLVEAYTRLLEVTEIEERLAKLEQQRTSP